MSKGASAHYYIHYSLFITHYSLRCINTDFHILPLSLDDLGEVLELEAAVIASLERPDQLRRNTPEMWRVCLSVPHVALGVRVGETLVALAVLYIPTPGDGEDLSAFLENVPREGLKSANYKICMVHPHFRGHALQQLLGRHLEEAALRQGVQLLCSTVSPHNPASIRSLQRLGYRYNRTLAKYGFQRALYYKLLSGANR